MKIMKKLSFLIILIFFSQILYPVLLLAQETEDELLKLQQEQKDIESNLSSPSSPSINEEEEGKIPDEKETTPRGGFKPFFYSLCLGPRIGLEYNEGRKVRTSESICWIPIVGQVLHVINAIDAWRGKAMSEVVAEEGLDE